MEKACTKCGEMKTLPEFYAKKGGKHGRESICVVCKVTMAREGYAPIKPPKPEVGEGEKYCTKCETVLSFASFNRNKTRHDGLANWCAECMNAKTKEWREENRGKPKKRKPSAYITQRNDVADYVERWADRTIPADLPTNKWSQERGEAWNHLYHGGVTEIMAMCREEAI